MATLRFTIALLLFSFNTFAQSPAQDTVATANYDTTGFTAIRDILNDSNWINSVMMDLGYLFMPDSATFTDAFNELKPHIGNNFIDITDAVKDTGFVSIFYYTKTKNLPGTLTNFIEDFEFFNHTITYTAPIDTGMTKLAADAKMEEWRTLLRKIFSAKNIKFNVKGEGSDQYDVTYYQPPSEEEYTNGSLGYTPGWELILRDITLKGKHHVELLIRRLLKD